MMLVSILLLASSCLALPSPALDHDLASNLAYRSPSKRVRALEVPLHEVHSSLRKRNNGNGETYTGNLTFPYNVASGDPYSDSAILWTIPEKLDLEGLYGGNSNPPICVKYEVSTSEDFASLATSGTATTTQDVRFSVKVEAKGLQPYTLYYYRFYSCAGLEKGASPVGTFKTLPAEDANPDQIRIAVFSCSNYPFGFFNAYGAAANHSQELDLWTHLGDYIYEYQNGAYGDGTAINRISQPLREISSLDDYRDRYASYRSDPDLQALHQKLAIAAVWDDHEVADNTYNAGSANSNDTAQGTVGGFQFTERKANAVRAYYEWMPIRQVDTDDALRIYRNFRVGRLFDMIMLDTRQYDRDITDLYYNTAEIEAVRNDSDRSITGEKQKNWFFDTLSKSKDRGAAWRLVMQQVIFSPLTLSSGGVNLDAWDGYTAERQAILDYWQQNDINDNIVLTGDTHASWVFDIPYPNYDPATGNNAYGVEFCGSAVSSPSSYGRGRPDAFYRSVASNLTAANPHLQYAEGQLRGYFELTVTPESVSAEYFGFYEQLTRNSNITTMGTFVTDKGTNRLRRPLQLGAPFGSVREN